MQVFKKNPVLKCFPNVLCKKLFDDTNDAERVSQKLQYENVIIYFRKKKGEGTEHSIELLLLVRKLQHTEYRLTIHNSVLIVASKTVGGSPSSPLFP